ncbi:MAG: Mur ligase family protein [Thermoleophilia bacterium]|nr:Mur ligase family protein [Thermoleophilia bacterium]
MAAKVALAKTVAAASGRAGHSGTTLPGGVIAAIDKGVIGRVSRWLPEGSVLVSATNGKTTTNAMIADILAREGMKVARNREGANLAAGVATALLKDASLTGRPRSDIGLFEVDEFALPEVAKQCSPRTVLLMNLFRDQLDRYGELEHIAERWRSAVMSLGSGTQAIFNADDPLVAAMATLRQDRTLCYGIEDTAAGGKVMQHASDSKYCTVCGNPFEYEIFYMGHLGKYLCPACGYSRPSPAIYAEKLAFDGMRGSRFDLVTPECTVSIKLPLPGLYNVYNALAAAACAFSLGIGPASVKDGLAAFSAAFGRVEQLVIEGKKVVMLLVKNPAGFNEVVRTLLTEPGKKSLLMALNDRIADGRDVSWIWDVDLEVVAPEIESAVTGGTRAGEMAMRLKYAGVDQSLLKVEPDLREALRQALRRTGEKETLYVLPTYTAMLALRQAIHQDFTTDRKLGDLVWK